MGNEEIFKGGNSKPRNPRMQTMLRMVGFGDNAGSGFPAILDVWKKAGWNTPELIEDTILSQVTLNLTTSAVRQQTSQESKSLEEKNERSFERSLSEIFKPKFLQKIQPILEYLKYNDGITPQKAKSLTGRSDATVRRYLRELETQGIVQKKGSTSNIIYEKSRE